MIGPATTGVAEPASMMRETPRAGVTQPASACVLVRAVLRSSLASPKMR